MKSVFGAHQLIDHTLARVTERRMPKVVTETDGFGEILVESQPPRHGAADLRHFKSVSETGAVMIAAAGQKHLSFIF